METKIGLNNTQRKMLDEVYTAHFDHIAKDILDERQRGLKKLSERVCADETKKHKAKIEAYHKSWQALVDLDDVLRKQGLRVFRYQSKPDRDAIEVCDSYSNPTLVKYEKETDDIRVELSRKKKEIRARIYGMDMTYEQVEKEIAKEIASIKK